MGESLTEQRRGKEEVIRDVNFCYKGRTAPVGNDRRVTVLYEEATANYVPAAAVIRRWQALSGITGCKGSVGGSASRLSKLWAQPIIAAETVLLE